MKYRILTYNIHGARGTDRKRDFARIGQLLKQHNIDLALIQEMDTRHSTSAVADLQSDHFPHFTAAPTHDTNKGWYGNAIFSKFPILRPRIIDISSKNREPRNILDTYVETPMGELHVVNTHKGLNSLERGSQLLKLYELLSTKCDVPLIVGGDINQWHYSKAMNKLNTSLHPLVTGPTFPTRLPFLPLDRFWCRPQELVLTTQVLRTPETRIYSDHYPLLAEIEMASYDFCKTKTVQQISP